MWVADLRLQLKRRGAKRKVPIRVSIGIPRPDGNDWSCPVVVKGLLDGNECKIFGVDSWQALTLALRLIERLLEAEIREGGTLFYLGEVTSVRELFGNRGR